MATDVVDLTHPAPFLVGDWEVNPGSCRVVRNGSDIKLTPRSMDVLVYLAARAGAAVTHDELLDAFWRGTISTRNAVQKCVVELRHAFGNGGGEPAYIETVPKRGYRLVAAVRQLEPPTDETRRQNGHIDERVADTTSALAASTAPSTEDVHQSHPGACSATPPVNGSAPFAPTDAASVPIRGRRTTIAIWSTAALLLVAAGSAGLYRTWSPFKTLVDRVAGHCFAQCEPKPATLAVLPFENLSGDPANAYLGEAMAVTVTEGIARSKEIALTAPGIAAGQRGTGRSAREVATALGVEHLLEGTVQRSGDQLRVTLQLIRATDGESLYTGAFEDSFGHLFALQAKMSEAVGQALSVHLNPDRRAQMLNGEAGGTTNVAAYLALAEAHCPIRNKAAAADVIEAARRAVELDPKYVDAYWCLIRGLQTYAESGVSAEQYRELLGQVREIRDLASKHIPGTGIDAATDVILWELTNDRVALEAALREQIKHPDPALSRFMNPIGLYASHVLVRVGLFDEAQSFWWLDYETRTGKKPDWIWEDWNVTLWRHGAAPAIDRSIASMNSDPSDVGNVSGLVALLARERRFVEAKQYLATLVTADGTGLWAHHGAAMVDVYDGRLRPGSSALAEFLASPLTDDISAGIVLFTLGDVDSGVRRWENLDPPQRRLLYYTRLSAEYHFPEAVRMSPQYRALLDRLGMGERWRHDVEERVRELEPYTGIGLTADHPDRRPPAEWRWKL